MSIESINAAKAPESTSTSRIESEYRRSRWQGPRRALVPRLLLKRAVMEELGDQRVGAQEIRKRMTQGVPGRPDETKPMTDEQTDLLLLRLMALSEQYLLTPANERVLDQEMRTLSLYTSLKDKKGEELLTAFATLMEKEEKEKEEKEKEDVVEKKDTSSEVPQESDTEEEDVEKVSVEKKDTSSEVLQESDIEEYRQNIKEEILGILRFSAVRSKYQALLDGELAASKGTSKNLADIQEAEALRGAARERLRLLRIQQVLWKEDAGGAKARKGPGIVPEAAAILREVWQSADSKVKRSTAGLSDQGRGMLAAGRLLAYKQQLDTTGFALTPSRQELLDEVSELAAQGFRICLLGPTGTGKTVLALMAIKKITENSFEVLSWSGETSIRDLFGRQVLTTTAAGIETKTSKAGYTKAVIGEKAGVLHDEMTTGQTSVLLALKALWAARPGEQISIPGFNGTPFTKEQMIEIATGNLKGRRHGEREEMDPAVAREFKAMETPFLPSGEMRDVILAELGNRAGFWPVSRTDMEMVEMLCKAAELSQFAYREKIPTDIKDSDLYQEISPTKDDIRLTKVFLDSGTTKDLFAGWRASGKSLGAFLKENLSRFIYRNPHFEELGSEQETLARILRAYGFHFEEGTPFYQAIRGGDGRPFVLPSEMGFLLKPFERSGDDDFRDDRRWKTMKVGETTFQYEKIGYEKKDATGGVIGAFQVGDTFKHGRKTYQYLGLLKDGTPFIQPV